jgi:signal transduction histidine kinase
MSEVLPSSLAAAFAGWAAAVSLLAIALALAAFGMWRRLRRSERALFLERMDRQQVEALAPAADAWIWQTDAEHRLVRLQPPAAGVRQSHAQQWIGQPVVELLRAVEGPSVLPAALERRSDLAALTCAWAVGGTPAASPRAMTIRALAQHDARGRFRGHLGVLQAERAASEGAALRPADGMPSRLEPADALSAQPSMRSEPGAAPRLDADAMAAEQASFTYTVTHDLRAPIRVIEGFTRIVKEDYAPVLDRMGVDHLDRVLGAAARMNAMIDALLALSRLSQQPLTRQPVNLSRLAEYIVDDLRRTSPERAVRVTIEPGMAAVGDPTLLRMALENLLGNAWKYTGKARDAQIWFQRDPAAPESVLLVRDNGAGFDMRFADRLFGVFQRLHSASDFPGTGIGLASVQRILRRHGGEIWAESAVGRGTTFRFTLGTVAAAAPGAVQVPEATTDAARAASVPGVPTGDARAPGAGKPVDIEAESPAVRAL